MVHRELGTLDYRAPRQRRSRARVFCIAAGIGAAVWCLALLVPFAVVGEYWGMVWFPFNVPLAAIVEDRYGISRDSYGWVGLITIANSTVIGLIVGSVAFLAAVRRSR